MDVYPTVLARPVCGGCGKPMALSRSTGKYKSFVCLKQKRPEMVARFTIDGIPALPRSIAARPPPRPARAESRRVLPTRGARNPGPQNASRGVRDCSWSLWRLQQRAPQAS